MDKTVKLRPFPGDAKDNSPQSNLTEDQDKSLELVKKNAQLEEEKKKSLEQAKTIEQLKESLKQEQAKSSGAIDQSAELEAKTKELVMLEAKIKDLSGALGKIASIAEAGKLAGKT